jgi:hypothetical protein
MYKIMSSSCFPQEKFPLLASVVQLCRKCCIQNYASWELTEYGVAFLYPLKTTRGSHATRRYSFLFSHSIGWNTVTLHREFTSRQCVARDMNRGLNRIAPPKFHSADRIWSTKVRMGMGERGRQKNTCMPTIKFKKLD